MDAENEYMLQQSLNKFKEEGRTVILIAHRLSTVKSADKILVIKNGGIIECGKHEELIENVNGEYFKLVKKQLFEQ